MLERLRYNLAARLLPPLPEDDRASYIGKELSPEQVGQAIISGGSNTMGVVSGRSKKEVLDAYNANPWLRAVVHKVARSTAMTTWRLFVARDAQGRATTMRKLQSAGGHATRQRLMHEAVQRKEANFEEIDEHPLLELLHTGNDILPGPTAGQLVQMYIDLTGEAFELKERSGSLTNERSRRGVVQRVLPIPPSWVEELPSKESPFFKIRFGDSGVAEPVHQDEIIMYRDPNPLNPYGRGAGTAGALADQLQSNQAAVKTIRTRLERNAIPPFIAMPEEIGGSVPGGGPSTTQINRVREEWERRLSGPDKGGGFVHFLKKRFKFEKLGQSFEELSLIPLLKSQRDTIIQVYGVPPEVLGIIESSNRATATVANTLFARHVLMPRLEQRRATLQRSLVNDFDDRLILDFESPVPEDEEAQREVMAKHGWAFNADEIRARAGEPPLEDGTAGGSHAVPANIFIEPSLSGAPGGDDEPPSPDDGEDRYALGSTMPPTLAGRGLFIINGDSTAREVTVGPERSRLLCEAPDAPYWIVLCNGADRRARRLGAVPYTRALAAAERLVNRAQLGDLEAVVVRQVANSDGRAVCAPKAVVRPPAVVNTPPAEQRQIDRGRIQEVVDNIDEKTLVDSTMPAFRDGVEAAGQQRLEELGLQPNFDLNDPKVVAFLAEQSSSQIRGINNTTREAVRATLAAGMEAGEGVNELARRVRTEFTGVQGKRSVVIARTESVRALNLGQVQGSAQAGMEGKQFLSTRDPRVRDTHAPLTGMDGQIRRIDANFNSPSGAAGQHPGAFGEPEEDINCRCTTLAVPSVPSDLSMSNDNNERPPPAWPPNADTEEKRTRIWKAGERQRKPIERSLRKAFKRGFAKQETAVINSLKLIEDTQ